MQNARYISCSSEHFGARKSRQWGLGKLLCEYPGHQRIIDPESISSLCTTMPGTRRRDPIKLRRSAMLLVLRAYRCDVATAGCHCLGLSWNVHRVNGWSRLFQTCSRHHHHGSLYLDSARATPYNDTPDCQDLYNRVMPPPSPRCPGACGRRDHFTDCPSEIDTLARDLPEHKLSWHQIVLIDSTSSCSGDIGSSFEV
jgi:hypothetical protein